jgi:dTDP-4-dehydrorhamnose reductase
MKILITGSSGMLGQALLRELSDKYEVVGMDIRKLPVPGFQPPAFMECDITDREKAIADIASIKPDIVIHSAAYADVDGCEQNPEKAHSVNAQGTETVSLACQKCGALLCYVSTDFVFGGEKESAYIESDKPDPVNIYGKSKLDGERFVQSILKDYIIVRSSWLFGKGGKNFADTIVSKLPDGEKIKVVNDQFGSPTYASDLARAIKTLLTADIHGIYHITNSNSCSWYEFARAIKEIAGLGIDIVPISSEQYRSPARRPKMSILKNRRYQETTGEKLRHWKEALGEYLRDGKAKR